MNKPKQASPANTSTIVIIFSMVLLKKGFYTRAEYHKNKKCKKH